MITASTLLVLWTSFGGSGNERVRDNQRWKLFQQFNFMLFCFSFFGFLVCNKVSLRLILLLNVWVWWKRRVKCRAWFTSEFLGFLCLWRVIGFNCDLISDEILIFFWYYRLYKVSYLLVWIFLQNFPLNLIST